MDENAGELYAKHIGEARAFAMSLVGRWMLAEDLAQDAFLRCVGKVSELNRPEAFRGYLLTAVLRACQSHERRRVAFGARLRQVSRAESYTFEDDVAEHGVLFEALISLPLRQRTAVVSRYLFDWPEAEVANLMGVEVGTVKSLSSRGLDRLRDVMREQEGALHG